MSQLSPILQAVLNLEIPILPVIKVDRAEDILPIADTLVGNGVKGLEITLRTDAGLKAIEIAAERFPDAVVCAGTVINVEQLKRVQDLGIKLVVTPGITAEILEYAAGTTIELIPGIATPSELMFAQSFGIERFKLFPASIVGGMGMLKALNGPFPNVKFCPTGGVNADNFKDFLALDNVFCVGGTWIMPTRDGKFDPIAAGAEIDKIKALLSI